MNNKTILFTAVLLTISILTAPNQAFAKKNGNRSIYLDGLTLKAALALCKIYPCFVGAATPYKYKKVKVKTADNKQKVVWLRKKGKRGSYQFRESASTTDWQKVTGKRVTKQFSYKKKLYKVVHTYNTAHKRGRLHKRNAITAKRGCLRIKKCRHALNRTIRLRTRYIPTAHRR